MLRKNNKYRYKKPFYKNNYSHHQRLTFQYKLQGILAIVLIIATVSLIYIQLDREVMPTIMAMAELQATTVATDTINEAVAETLSSNQTTIEDLLSYDYNDSGELISWNVNSVLINILCAEIVSKTTDELQNIGTISLKVPLGNLTGSRIFANLGPDISVKVLPIGTVKVDYENDIKSTGINQINHTVWLNIETTIQVVVPLVQNQITVNRRVMLIDKVISGKVPPSYVNVPQDSILDVAPGAGMLDITP